MRIHVARNFLPPTLRAIEKKVSVFVCCLDQPVAGELSNKNDFGIYAYQLLKRMKPNLIQIYNHEQILELLKGLASYCKAETTFTFYFTILPLPRAFLSINNREMKSESGFSFAMASQPLKYNLGNRI